ncbi:hypothetical protein AB0M36_17650 [Actinoplanes sp. NPDC051346]|uniref:hypothetical protein n=1 Tax=Actinoplanes sp. NPDC051346 TaxID=3155048 RepID=UPI0034418E89
MELVAQLADLYAHHLLFVILAALLLAGVCHVIALIRCDRAGLAEILRSLAALIRTILRR